MDFVSDNRGNKFNRTIFFILVAYYSLTTIMPAVAHFISAYIYMATVVLLFILIIMRTRENFNYYLGFMLPLLFLVIMQVLDAYINKTGSVPLLIYSKMLLLVPILLMHYLLVNNNRSMIRWLIIIALAAFIITALTTYLGLLRNPNAARILATIEDSKNPIFIRLGRQNIGGFETIYSIVLLMPMIICLYKQRRLHFFVFAAVALIMFICILQSQYATALMLFLLSAVLFFVKRRFTAKNVWMLLLVIASAYFLLKPIVAKLLFELANNVQSYTLAERFIYLSNTLRGIEYKSDVGNRFNLYRDSINYFLKYPFSGSWLFEKYGSGGHSFILDTLAQYGIIGGAALFVFFRQIYIKLYYPFKNTEYYGFLLWNFLLFIFLSILNPTGFLIVLCFIVPGIAYIIQDKDYRIGDKGVPCLESNVGM